MSVLHTLLSRVFPPTHKPIAELDVGRLVTVRGTVVPRDLMDNPVTGTPCVYYSYSIQRWRQSRVGGDVFWDITDRDEAILEFYIDDSSGRAIVAPWRARVDRTRRIAPATHELGGERRAQLLLIEPGDLIEVSAEVVSVADLYDEGRSYRERPERLMLRAPEQNTLTIRLLRKGGAAGRDA
ncbi:MAG: hypothetical protein AAGC55_12650 [Myxococcota bacterium]